MELKALLISIIFVHACDGSEHNFTVTSETSETTENQSFSDWVVFRDYFSFGVPINSAAEIPPDGSEHNFTVTAETSETTENQTFSDWVVLNNYFSFGVPINSAAEIPPDGSEHNFTVTAETSETTENQTFSDWVVLRDYFSFGVPMNSAAEIPPDGSEHNFTVTSETSEKIENQPFFNWVLYLGTNSSEKVPINSSIKIHPDASEHNFTVTAETSEKTEMEGVSDNDDIPPENIIDLISVDEENIPVAQPGNSTNLNYSKTMQDSYNISDESVNFLKGLLVTRIMPSFYIIIILVSLPLNTLALVTFTCKIREKKPAVVYMCHLACVDLLFTVLLPLKIHYQMNASDWVFGEEACRVLTAAFYCYMYCSILLMMCTSVDRLLAVVFPIASLTWRSSRKASCICALVWLLALAGTAPLLAMTQTFKINDVGITCHDVLYQTQVYVNLFSVLSCLYFFLPLVVTLVSYSAIIYVLSTKPNLSATSSSGKERRAVIMAISVLSVFVICFAPTNGILLYHCVRLSTIGGTEEGKYYVIAVCLGSASVFLDPLLYYYGSSQCREKISSLICWRKTKSTTTLSNT